MTNNANTVAAKANASGVQEMSAMVAVGTACLENGDLGGALQAYEQVIAAFPDRPEGHNNLGALYNAMGDYPRAERCFTRVLEILPDNPSIYYNRGMARSSQEKFDTARRDFLKALEFDTRDADCLNNLGVMDFMQGRFNDAKLRFRQALEARPDNPRALLNLCDVEMAQGNTFAAVDLCENFLKTRNNVEVRRTLLDILSTGCRTALEKAGRTAESLLSVGVSDPDLDLKLDRIRQAKALLEEMAEI